MLPVDSVGTFPFNLTTPSRLLEATITISYVALVLGILGYITLGHLALTTRKAYEPKTKKFLLVTAHPDDECMFFGPIITRLVSDREEVHVLCLCEGGSKERIRELKRSCDRLGIPRDRVSVVRRAELRDGKENNWNANTVAEEIRRELNKIRGPSNESFIILTFDKKGVSLHPNHTSAYLGVCTLLNGEQNKNINNGTAIIEAYSLETIGIATKYIVAVGLWYYVVRTALLKFRNETFLVARAPLKHYLVTRRAMLRHVSQLKWYRMLYLHTSCYMLVNLLRPISTAGYPEKGHN